MLLFLIIVSTLIATISAQSILFHFNFINYINIYKYIKHVHRIGGL
jgi:hypothetical protein